MKLKAFLRKISLRYRLHRICKAIGIKPYGWQRRFALGKTNVLDAPSGRATGKTMAVMLRLLLAEPEHYQPRVPASMFFESDPDWRPSDRLRCNWYYGEYLRLWRICYDAEIYPFYLYSRYNPYKRRTP